VTVNVARKTAWGCIFSSFVATLWVLFHSQRRAAVESTDTSNDEELRHVLYGTVPPAVRITGSEKSPGRRWVGCWRVTDGLSDELVLDLAERKSLRTLAC